jgi:hypothetical protein
VLVELGLVEQRHKAVLEVLAGALVGDLAMRNGATRQTVHRRLRRYAALGIGGLADHSCRPASCPHQMSPETEARILELREAHPGWGPRTLRHQLDREGVVPPPGRSSIHRLLVRHGLADPQKRRRKREDYRRWERTRSMELWQMDIMGGVAGETYAEYIPNHICSSKTVLHKVFHSAEYPSHVLLPVIALSKLAGLSGRSQSRSIPLTDSVGGLSGQVDPAFRDRYHGREHLFLDRPRLRHDLPDLPHRQHGAGRVRHVRRVLRLLIPLGARRSLLAGGRAFHRLCGHPRRRDVPGGAPASGQGLARFHHPGDHGPQHPGWR